MEGKGSKALPNPADTPELKLQERRGAGEAGSSCSARISRCDGCCAQQGGSWGSRGCQGRGAALSLGVTLLKAGIYNPRQCPERGNPCSASSCHSCSAAPSSAQKGAAPLRSSEGGQGVLPLPGQFQAWCPAALLCCWAGHRAGTAISTPCSFLWQARACNECGKALCRKNVDRWKCSR